MIDKPGVYQIPAVEYHADPCVEPSLSASIANCILQQSPAHARMRHPRLTVDPQTDESERFDIGTAAHALLLEKDSSRFVWVPHNDWRTNAAKELRDTARGEGKLPILTRYQGVLQKMVEVARGAVEQSEFAGIWMHGKPEQTIVWHEDGVWLRCRPDFMRQDRTIILDYKTAASAAPETFIRQIGNMGYDVSADFSLRGLAALGETHQGATGDPAYVFLAQEIEPPFACSFHTLGTGYREIAEEKVERAIQVWRMCMQSGQWPAYSLKLHHAEPPAWEMAAYEARMAQVW